MMGNVSKVYCHITRGLLSKPDYMADSVIGVYEEKVQDAIREALEESGHIES